MDRELLGDEPTARRDLVGRGHGEIASRPCVRDAISSPRDRRRRERSTVVMGTVDRNREVIRDERIRFDLAIDYGDEAPFAELRRQEIVRERALCGWLPRGDAEHERGSTREASHRLPGHAKREDRL